MKLNKNVVQVIFVVFACLGLLAVVGYFSGKIAFVQHKEITTRTYLGDIACKSTQYSTFSTSFMVFRAMYDTFSTPEQTVRYEFDGSAQIKITHGFSTGLLADYQGIQNALAYRCMVSIESL